MATYKTHKVVKGDTLSEIAVKYNTTVSYLAKLNNIKKEQRYCSFLLPILILKMPVLANAVNNNSFVFRNVTIRKVYHNIIFFKLFVKCFNINV